MEQTIPERYRNPYITQFIINNKRSLIGSTRNNPAAVDLYVDG
jgi:hypothetical protein